MDTLFDAYEILNNINIYGKFGNDLNIENIYIYFKLNAPKNFTYINESEYVDIEYELANSIKPFIANINMEKIDVNSYKIVIQFLCYYKNIDEKIAKIKETLFSLIKYYYTRPCKKVKK